MYLLSALPLPLLFVVPSFALTLHESLPDSPDGWSQTGTPAGSDMIVLQVALQQQNLDKLESTLYDVSTPGSASYGKWLDKDAADALVAPSSEAGPAVESWLKGAGVDHVHTEGEYVTFAATIDNANKLLSTEFHYYESDGLTKLRTTEYSIPDNMVQHVDFVHPTTFFGKTTAQAPANHQRRITISKRQSSGNSTGNSSTVDASCAELITPTCIKELYDIGNYTGDPKSGSKIGFGSFLNQSARTDDLSLFEQKYNLPKQGFSVELINGGVNDQSIGPDHGEADLDVEYIVGTSGVLPIISYITGGSP